MVCFRAFHNHRDVTEWYTFDAMDPRFDCEYSSSASKAAVKKGSYCDRCFHSHPFCHHRKSDDHNYATHEKLIPLVSCQMTRLASWAVLPNSDLYCVGCSEAPPADVDCRRRSIKEDVGKPHNQAFIFNNIASESSDIQQPCWKSCNSTMLSSRKHPHPLVLNGQLFLISGISLTYDDDDDDNDNDDDDEDDDDIEDDDDVVYVNEEPAEFTLTQARDKVSNNFDPADPAADYRDAYEGKFKFCAPVVKGNSTSWRSDLLDFETLLNTPKETTSSWVVKRYSSPFITLSQNTNYIRHHKNKSRQPRADDHIVYSLNKLSAALKKNPSYDGEKEEIQVRAANIILQKWRAWREIKSNYLDHEPWAEVFNPANREWKALPEPPSRIHESYRSGFICAALEDEQVILVGSAKVNVLYSYSLQTRSWSILKGHKLDPSCSGKAVVVGHTLYWFTTRGYLMAYDLNKKMWYKGIIDGNWDHKILGTYSFHPGLLHLESNLFCLLWAETEIYGTVPSLSQRSHLHCLKFQVSTSNPTSTTGKGSLIISINSCHSRPIDHGITFVDCVVL